ncbi:MAG: transposase, partial [Bilifractor sp.]|nr:transposase [Bilifractor sp.]
MLCLEADCPYQNADETFLRVVGEEGSRPSRKYYVWVFSAGELLEGHPVIVCRYGPSRSAENLREQMGILDYLRTITCDAYAAYDTVAKESDGKISVSNCLSHARRRWVLCAGSNS